MADVKLELRADGSAVLAELKRVTSGVDDFGKRISSAADLAQTAFAAVGAALSLNALAQVVTDATQLADQLADTAANINTTATELQGLRLAAIDAGGSAAGLDRALSELQKRIGQAAREGGTAAESFERLGLNAAELSNLGSADALFEVADAVAGLGTQAEQAAASAEFFGKTSRELVQTIAGGSAPLRAAIDRYAELGFILDEQTVAGLERANRQFELLGTRLDIVRAQIVSGFVPALSVALDTLLQINGQAGGVQRTSEAAAAGLAGLGLILSNTWNVAKAAIDSLGMSIFALASVLTTGGLSAEYKRIADEFQAAAEAALNRVKSFEQLGDEIGARTVASLAKIELAAAPAEAALDAVAVEVLALGQASADGLLLQLQGQLDGIARSAKAAATATAELNALRAGIAAMRSGTAPLAPGDFQTPQTTGMDPLGATMAPEVQLQREIDLQNQMFLATQQGLAMRLQAHSEFNDLVLALTGERIAFEEQLEQAKTQTFGALLGTALASFAATNEKVAKLAQSIAIAQAVWNTATGVTKALAAYDYVGAAKIAIMGAAQIAKIRATKYTGSVVSGGSTFPAGAAGGSGGGANERVAEAAQTSRTVEVQVKGTITDQAGRVIADLVRREIRDRNTIIIDSDSRQAQELTAAAVPGG